MKPYVTYSLLVVNIAVFAAWSMAGTNDQLAMFMIQNFLVSSEALAEGRVWTIVTSMFSHNLVWHLLLNMFALNSFGAIMEEGLGAGRFLRFYFAAGIVGSICHALVSAQIIGDPSVPAHGASGAISGLILLFALCYPKQKLLIMGIIPIPALIGALAFIGFDIWGIFAQADGGGLPIGHGAHLGGAAVGMGYYLFFMRGRRV